MPRLLNCNPKYRKHKASGQAIVSIEGRDFYLGPWNTKASKAEYDRIIAQWLANGRHLARDDADLAIAELIDRYWEYAQSYYRQGDGTATGELHPLKAVLKIINRLYGPTPASEFGPLALETLRNEMISIGWCRRVINAQMSRLKAMFKWAVAKELILPAVYQALCAVSGLRAGKSAARESAPVRPVSDEVVDATLPHMGRIVAAMVQLQRLTGARPGEICCMRIGHIDRSKSDVWVYRPLSHKTAHHGHDRQIFIGPKAQDVLRPFLLKLDPQDAVFSPIEAVAEFLQHRAEQRVTPLSCGNGPGTNRQRRPRCQPGEFYGVPEYRRAITRACIKAFPAPKDIADDPVQFKAWRKEHHWHPHQLRHTAATAIRRQFGIEAAQHMLGHATLNVTEIYAEKNADAARKIAEKVG